MNQTLSLGDNGTNVIMLQKYLVAKGYQIAVDGSFGPNTEAALEAFQKVSGLTVDGIAGPITLSALGVVQSSPTNYLMGVDTSHYEASFDFAKAVADGCVFMMTKISDGVSEIDPTRATLTQSAKAAGIVYRGGYHFFRANESVPNQVSLYLANVQPLNLEMPCILDCETASQMGMPLTTVRSAALEFLQAVEQATGRTPMIYGGESFLQSLNLGDEFLRYPLWLADYSHPLVPSPWATYTFWQYTESGEEGADTNRFNGTMAQLQAFCAK